MLIVALVLILVIAGIDQLIKMYILENFVLYQERPFLQIGSLDIMHLKYIQNDGSAFSSFSGQRALLLIVTTIGMGICSYLLIKYGKKSKLLYTSLIMILGGALGNMIDRIFRDGLVVDYLDLQLFQFAVFNFADCFVTVGTVLLMIYILFFMDEEKKHDKT
ncbi:MAG: signal peptidase II [Oscillospiraceae bacterium]|nr:signal peptidase II [Oscillospiraceae bacterium]